MAENHVLRGLLKNVAGFIGEGAGGFMSKLGWDMADFENLVNKSETDTAWESFQNRKHSQKTSQTSSAMTSMLGVQSVAAKRPAEDDRISAPAKKARVMTGPEQNGDRRDAYSLMLPITSTVPTGSLYQQPPAPGHSPQENFLSDLMHPGSSNSPVFMSTTTSTPSNYSGSTAASYGSYVPQMNMNVEQGLGTMSYSSSKVNTAVPAPQRVVPQSNEEPDDNDATELRDPKKIEAMKLIKLVLHSCSASHV